MRVSTLATLLVLVSAPAYAQQGTSTAGSGSQGAAGHGGNGVTTSSSSGPEAKTGAQRSPSGGAPTTGGEAGSPRSR